MLIVGRGTIAQCLVDHLPTWQWARNGDLRTMLALPGPGVAVICSAVTGFERCEQNPAWSRAINVGATWAMADQLAHAGWRVVMLSSTAAEKADSEYGRQKRDLERAWVFGPILRLPKVLTPRLPLLRSWATSLQAGKPIAAFTTRICPIGPSHVATAVSVVSRESRGLFLAAGPRTTWFDVARHMAGDRIDLVTPDKSGARISDIDSDDLRRLGWHRPTLDQVMAEANPGEHP